MNSLILLPLLAAACVASPLPGGIARAAALNGGFLNAGFVQPGLVNTGFVQYSAVHQPAIQQVQVQVPVTKTVHYETKPVVTGYSTSIIKPAIPHGFAAAVPLPQVAAAPVLVQGRQLPPLPSFPIIPQPNGTADNPAFPSFPNLPQFPNPNTTADAPQFPTIPGFPSFPPVMTPPGDNETAQQTIAQPAPVPIAVEQPSQDAVVVEARSVPAPVQQVITHQAPIAVQQPVVAFRAAQAGDFGPIVTKQQVLAPVRTHTQITPQVTQIQPEVTVRKVIHDVPVQTPVAVHTPVTYAVHSPVVATQQVVTGHQLVGHQTVGLRSTVLGGQHFVGHNVLGQQIIH